LRSQEEETPSLPTSIVPSRNAGNVYIRPASSVQTGDDDMSRIFAGLLVAAVMLTSLAEPASATLNCLSKPQAFALAEDTVSWSMTIVPGADCIQGLRWSYMQIDQVTVASAPKNGKLVIVGPGFRYFADPGFQGSDRFTVTVSGKNRKAAGNSTLEIEIQTRAKDVQLLSSLQQNPANENVTPLQR
jgi:Bacterial Ig domain